MGTVVSVEVYVNKLCYDYSANIPFSFFTTALTYTLNMRRAFSTTSSLEGAFFHGCPQRAAARGLLHGQFSLPRWAHGQRLRREECHVHRCSCTATKGTCKGLELNNAWFIATGNMSLLSEEQVVDCDTVAWCAHGQRLRLRREERHVLQGCVHRQRAGIDDTIEAECGNRELRGVTLLTECIQDEVLFDSTHSDAGHYRQG